MRGSHGNDQVPELQADRSSTPSVLPVVWTQFERVGEDHMSTGENEPLQYPDNRVSEVELLKTENTRLREELTVHAIHRFCVSKTKHEAEHARLRKEVLIQEGAVAELARLRETLADLEPKAEALYDENARLREALSHMVKDFEAEKAEVARLREVEKAARVFTAQPGARLAPPFEQAWLDLCNALKGS